MVGTVAVVMGQAGAPQGTQKPFQQITHGEAVVTFLTPSDDSLPDGSFYKGFVFTAATGEWVTITLRSLDFDAALLLTDSLGAIARVGWSDDDSGGECNAHLTTRIPVSGRYRILATSKYPGEVGEFQLSLARGEQEPSSTERCAGFFELQGTLSPNDSAVGALALPLDQETGSNHFHVWSLAVPPDQTVTVDLISDEFDAQLTLYQGFRTPLDADDDGAGKCNARLVLTGGDHPQRIVITAGGEGGHGKYLLRMVTGALPLVERSECTP
jgi:serine protease Do